MNVFQKDSHRKVEHLKQAILELHDNDNVLLLALNQARQDVLMRMATDALCPPAKDGELHD